MEIVREKRKYQGKTELESLRYTQHDKNKGKQGVLVVNNGIL